MDATLETLVDYKPLFEETVLQLFQCRSTLATTTDQLAQTRKGLEQTELEFDEYRTDMQVVVIGGAVVIVALVMVVVYIAARQGVRSA